MQHVDEHRTELSELMELHHARFDSRINQQAAELHRALETGFARIDTSLARLEGSVDTKLAQLGGSVDTKLAQLGGSFEAKLERRFADLLKWSFVFWVGAVAAIAALAQVLRSR